MLNITRGKNKKIGILIALIVAIAVLGYYHSESNNNAGRNVQTKSTVTYPTGNLTGFTQIYNIEGVSGSQSEYFTVPQGTECLAFLMYSNNTISTVTVFNSTGSIMAQDSVNSATEHFSGDRLPYVNLKGPGNWYLKYNIHTESNWNFNFKIFASRYIENGGTKS